MKTGISLQQFLSTHLAALEKDQARYNLILGILERAKADPSKIRLWSFASGTACAVQTPPHLIVLGELNSEQSDELAGAVRDLDFLGCIGADQNAERFSQSLHRQGVTLRLSMPQRIYVLKQPPIYPKSEGQGRRAKASDFPLFADWLERFAREAVPNDPVPSRDRIAQMFSQCPVFFWEVNGVPVSMAARNRETRDGSNISHVYTPPEFRGKGYGGSATALTCESVFADGKKTCFLYTDLRNPVSNRVYQKIGFKPWCDSSTYIRA